MGDILTFTKIYSDEIDHDQFCRVLGQIHGWIFFQQMLAICRRYLGIEPDELGWELTAHPEDFAPMLLDMLEAGIYGQSTLERKHSAAILVQQTASADASQC